MTVMGRVNDLPHEDRDEVLRAVGSGRAVRDPALASLAVPMPGSASAGAAPALYRQPLYVGAAIVMTVLVALVHPWWAVALAGLAFAVVPLATRSRVVAAVEAERVNRLLLS